MTVVFAFALATMLFSLSHAQQPITDPLPDPVPSDVTIELVQVVTGFVFPTDVVEVPGRSDTYVVTERDGTVRIVVNGEVRGQPFLLINANTVSNAGSALSSLAFHPGFAAPGDPGESLFYTVSQEAPGTGTADFGDSVGAVHQSVIYEWRLSSADPERADPASGRVIMRIDESTTVHNVDDLVFGLDGALFVTKGDDDMTFATRLDGSTIHGSVLRIQLDPMAPNGRYRVPGDNPFVGNVSGIIEEIYAYGFRNPWRASIDRMTGELHVADIGEDDIEEIERVEAGRYYGWIDKEGSFAFLNFAGVSDDLSDLPQGFDGVDPIAEYDHSLGRRSITGGFVYRGSLYPALYGHYVFGDWLSRELMHVDPADGRIQVLQIDPGGAMPGAGIISVRQDLAGELLVVTTEPNGNATGQVLRWVAETVDPDPEEPPAVTPPSTDAEGESNSDSTVIGPATLLLLSLIFLLRLGRCATLVVLGTRAEGGQRGVSSRIPRPRQSPR